MKFKNTTGRSIRVAKYGWVKPGETLEVPNADPTTIGNLSAMTVFETVTAKKKAKNTSTTKASK
jgi:hypothetical protein